MFYKNSSCIGIRQKFGEKKQVFSFGGKKASLSENALRGWADMVLERLDEGQSVPKVKAWITGAIA